MNFIAHRGNMYGPNPALENRYSYILEAYNTCGKVEIDLQTHNGVLYLGHDEPQEEVRDEIKDFITQPGVYCHSKDTESLSKLLTYGAHTFYHETDPVTFTSRGFMWCFPGVYVKDITKAIWLDMPWHPLPQKTITACFAVCGDYWAPYR